MPGAWANAEVRNRQGSVVAERRARTRSGRRQARHGRLRTNTTTQIPMIAYGHRPAGVGDRAAEDGARRAHRRACSRRSRRTGCRPRPAAGTRGRSAGRSAGSARTTTRSGCRGHTGGACCSGYAVGSLMRGSSAGVRVGSAAVPVGLAWSRRVADVTDSMTTSLDAACRSHRCGTAAIASTTSRLGPSATSPKIVCLPCSQVVGADGDEELRAVGALAHALAGVGHGEHVGLGEVLVGADLVVERVARAADALTERAAALDHEAGDDAVEDQAVVERGRVRAAGVVPVLLARPWPGRRSSRPSSGPGRGRA